MEGQFRAGSQAEDMPGMSGGRYTLSDSSVGQKLYGVDADWDVLGGIHIGATWRIRLNRPCAAAMRPYVKLFLTTCLISARKEENNL